MLPNLGKRVCKYCDAPVANHGANEHCGDLKCKLKYMEEKKQETKRYWDKREADHATQLKRYAETFAAEQGVDIQRVGTATIPSCQYKLKPLAQDRIDEFKAHIKHCADTLDTEADDREFKTPRATEVPEELKPIAIQACTTCRGDCCKQGFMFNAFIRRVTLKRVLDSVEGVSLENLVETYSRYIPEESIQYSCLFHTDKGCNLADELRADICGDFFCLPASSYIVELREKEVPDFHVFAAGRNCDVDVVRVVDCDGNEVARADSLDG